MIPIRPLDPIARSAYPSSPVDTTVYTVLAGRAAGGSVPIRVGSVPAVLVCVAAPCRCTTPDRSVYQAGAREPNPALPDQFAVLTGIGAGPDAARAAPVAMMVPLSAAAPLSAVAVSHRAARAARRRAGTWAGIMVHSFV